MYTIRPLRILPACLSRQSSYTTHRTTAKKAFSIVGGGRFRQRDVEIKAFFGFFSYLEFVVPALGPIGMRPANEKQLRWKSRHDPDVILALGLQEKKGQL